MTLDEMIREVGGITSPLCRVLLMRHCQFDLALLTHRRSVLDPLKLEYLNKHHLTQKMKSLDGLYTLAERLHTPIKEAFPQR